MPRFIRPISIQGNIAFVPLTMGFYAVIDIEDVHKVDKWNWRVMRCAKTNYAVRQYDAQGKSVTVCMHRLLINAPKNLQVDHIDRNGLNNQKQNLRLATASQNQQNKGKYANNKSGYKGVSWHKLSKKWQSQIRYNGRVMALGLFVDPHDAHLAYMKASEELHGKFGSAS